jgi:phasin family protein
MSSVQAAPFSFPPADLVKAWGGVRLPSISIATLLEAHRKNAAALTSANQIAFDGLSAVAQRQGDLIKTTVDDYSRMTSDVLAAPSLEEKATRQADATRHIHASAVVRFRELCDVAVKANLAAIDIMSARITEAFDEFKALFAAPTSNVATSGDTPAAVATRADDIAAPPVAVTVTAEAPVVPPASVAPQPTPAAVDPEPTPEPTVTVPKTGAPAPRAPRRPPSRR